MKTKPTIVIDTSFLSARPYARQIIDTLRNHLKTMARVVISPPLPKSRTMMRSTVWITDARDVYLHHPPTDTLIAIVDYKTEVMPPALIFALNRYADEIWTWSNNEAEACKRSGILPEKLYTLGEPTSESTTHTIAARITAILETRCTALDRAVVE